MPNKDKDKVKENCDCNSNSKFTAVVFNFKKQIKDILQINIGKKYKNTQQTFLKFNSKKDEISFLLFFDAASLKKT